MSTQTGPDAGDDAAPAPPPGPFAGQSTGRLVGRDAEQAALRVALGRLAAGRGGLVVVHGQVGSGKTRLVDEVLAGLPGPGPLRLTARQTERDVPLALWTRLTAAVTGRWLGAVPVGASGLDAARWVRPELQPAPLVVVVDRAEDADEASAAMLADLGATAPGVPLLLVLLRRTAVPVAAPEPAEAAGRSGDVVRLDLLPLSDEVLADIARAAGVRDDEMLARVVRLAAGNPLLAEQVAAATVDGTALAPAARDLLAARVRAVDDTGVVVALALLGRPATSSLLSTVVEVEPRRLQASLDAAVAAGLVERTGVIGRYRPALPLLTEAALAATDTADVRSTHRRIAGALAATAPVTGDVAEATRHLIAAGVGGDQVTRACLDTALHAEARQRYEEAEELAAYGLDGGGTDVATVVALRRVLGRCLARQGRTAAAREVLENAVALADGLDRWTRADVVADLAVADLIWLRGGPERAQLLESARRDVPEGSPVHSRLTAALAAALYLTDLPRSRRLAAQALEDAVRCDDDGTTLAVATYAAAFGTSMVRDGEHVRRVTALWHDSPSASHSPPVVHLGPSLATADRPGVDYVLARAEHAPRRLPLALERGLGDVTRLGRAVLDADADEVARLATALHSSDGTVVPSLAAVAQLTWAIHSGTWLDLPPATLAALMPTSGLGRLFLNAAEAVSLYHGGRGAGPDGDRAVAAGALSRRRDELLALPDDLTHDVAAALLAFLGHELEDEQMCRTALTSLAGHEEEFVVLGAVVPIGPVGWFVGWARQGLGDLDGALAANAAARAASARLGAVTWTVLCDHQEAFLLRHRDPAGSRRVALRAAELAERHGLDAAARRARRLLPADGAPRRVVPGGRHGEILRLAAAGLTNDQIARRLFLSVSTVERHFTQIYRTLGVRNRAEAIGFLAQPTAQQSGQPSAQQTASSSAPPVRRREGA